MANPRLHVELTGSMDEVEQRVRTSLAEQGFGVLTEIDVAGVFKAKLDLDRPPLKILGACNPVLASQAIGREVAAALVLPCNVVLEERQPGHVVVTVADPVEMMPGEGFEDLAEDATTRLIAALDDLAS